MTRFALLLCGLVLGALSGAGWVLLDLGSLPVGTPAKISLWILAPLLLLAGLRRLTTPTTAFDAAWILLYLGGAATAFLAAGMVVGMGGMR